MAQRQGKQVLVVVGGHLGGSKFYLYFQGRGQLVPGIAGMDSKSQAVTARLRSAFEQAVAAVLWGALCALLAAFLWQHNCRPRWVQTKRHDELLGPWLGDWPVKS